MHGWSDIHISQTLISCGVEQPHRSTTLKWNPHTHARAGHAINWTVLVQAAVKRRLRVKTGVRKCFLQEKGGAGIRYVLFFVLGYSMRADGVLVYKLTERKAGEIILFSIKYGNLRHIRWNTFPVRLPNVVTMAYNKPEQFHSTLRGRERRAYR